MDIEQELTRRCVVGLMGDGCGGRVNKFVCGVAGLLIVGWVEGNEFDGYCGVN